MSGPGQVFRSFELAFDERVVDNRPSPVTSVSLLFCRASTCCAYPKTGANTPGQYFQVPSEVNCRPQEPNSSPL